jgi:hypothetical protein
MSSETKRINDRIKFDTIKNRIDDDNNNNDDDDDDDDALRTDITLIALGNVRVETMSWIQVIRNKYGFNDKLNPISTSSSHHTNKYKLDIILVVDDLLHVKL